MVAVGNASGNQVLAGASPEVAIQTVVADKGSDADGSGTAGADVN